MRGAFGTNRLLRLIGHNFWLLEKFETPSVSVLLKLEADSNVALSWHNEGPWQLDYVTNEISDSLLYTEKVQPCPI